MTIKNKDYKDAPYWNKLISLLQKPGIEQILKDSEVKERCNNVVKENKAFEKYLIQHTKLINNISITDFRTLDTVPDGNRFLPHSLFPKSIANVKIRFANTKHEHVQISIGQNIFNKQCNVNIGTLLAQFGGGGHAGAGGCTLKADRANKAIKQILELMFQNKKEDTKI